MKLPTLPSTASSVATTNKVSHLFDLQKARADTPACEKLIHFNNAGASLMPQPVYQAVLDHLQLEQTIGGYEAAAENADKLDSFYSAFANLLNASRDEIAFVENATRAWDMAVYAIPWRAGDRVLVHQSEYSSNYLALLQLAREKRIQIDQVPSGSDGAIDLEQLQEMIHPQTRAIFLTYVPSQSGLVNPAGEVGDIARDNNLLYVLDACQAAGQMPIDVQQIGCDILSGTGRKFLRGPRGTGFLYVRKERLDTLEPPFIDLHSAAWTADHDYEFQANARRFENWECFAAGKIGLAAAANYAMEVGLSQIQQRVFSLAQTLRTELSTIDCVKVHDPGSQRCGIVTFSCENKDAEKLVAELRAEGINTSVTARRNARLDFQQRKVPSAVRASLHYFNNDDEIANFCQVIESKLHQ
ncbi:aminotransferase class V-fold PLP-dependent enzyme [Porticoccus sp. W117]|uniref:aminotransferase class V-fold PLP-dependent enzyme n=1 Tax=Porticoccus sp. W117 TaxID=3054777 RepID=UPI00259A51A9|nr:aminotransferase class V-fold PLP-dependent enzyme [Porticoccus sp. W117]MDM3871372.1 aminotransferase class V-fold PLP-dependent enzyme [Porticoccus sp. W117]